jgi:hypothetical protein
MKRSALAAAILLAAALSAFAQDTKDKEIEKLKAEVERLKKQLAEFEETHIDVVREKKRLEDEKHKALAPPVVVTDPKLKVTLAKHALKPLEGKVTAVADEIDLVVLSVGKDDGVQEGDEFVVERGLNPVCRVRIDRVDGKWSAGKVTHKKDDPRVGDAVRKEALDASRASGPASAFAKAADELRAVRRELDEVRKAVREMTDRLVASWNDPGVAVEPVPEALAAHLGMGKGGVMVTRVREGSIAARAGLQPFDVFEEGEAVLLAALKPGGSVTVTRKGKPVKIEVPK